MDELAKYFNKDTIGDIKWAHAVNDIKYLEKALTNSSVDFLEVDISISKGGGPIAAHYHNESDLSIEVLLNKVKHFNKGLKLDFKEQATVSPTLRLLHAVNLDQPVILNADILSAKDAPAAIIQPEIFIKACSSYYPTGLLSLGWRTTEDSTYSKEDIDEMLAICRGMTNITFPVRASLLPLYWEEIKKLIDSENHTLSIWNGRPVNKRLEQWLNQYTDSRKCFYDLSYAQV
jgi:hypothetical protein